MRAYKGLLLIAICAVLLLVFVRSGARVSRYSDMREYDVSKVKAWYDRLEDTELSDLRSDLFCIIDERMACYHDNLMTAERVRECRRKYVRSIVDLARQRIRSAPMLGDAILCFQYCPMSYALCKGDNMNGKSVDCATQEARCIENCLDRYWRGGAFSNGSFFSQ